MRVTTLDEESLIENRSLKGRTRKRESYRLGGRTRWTTSTRILLCTINGT